MYLAAAAKRVGKAAEAVEQPLAGIEKILSGSGRRPGRGLRTRPSPPVMEGRVENHFPGNQSGTIFFNICISSTSTCIYIVWIVKSYPYY